MLNIIYNININLHMIRYKDMQQVCSRLNASKKLVSQYALLNAILIRERERRCMLKCLKSCVQRRREEEYIVSSVVSDSSLSPHTLLQYFQEYFQNSILRRILKI